MNNIFGKYTVKSSFDSKDHFFKLYKLEIIESYVSNFSRNCLVLEGLLRHMK